MITATRRKSLTVMLAALLTASLITVVACNKEDDDAGGGNTQTQTDAGTAIANWPQTSKMVAQEMIAKYGQPQGVTSEMLVWNNNGPWKRTIVSRDTVAHNFPTPHPDLLEQVINYKVPTDKFDEMAEYDGSVIIERTKGEMSARCDKEGANFLAINLANEVATGAKTKEQARDFYTQSMKTFKMTGQMNNYMQGLLFTPPSNSMDPDVATF